MNPSSLIALGVEIFQISIQVYKAVKTVMPELIELWDTYQILGDRFLSGEEITEDEVKALRQKIKILSESNAKLEDAIIRGDV